jgi:hypothetical protein
LALAGASSFWAGSATGSAGELDFAEGWISRSIVEQPFKKNKATTNIRTLGIGISKGFTAYFFLSIR